MSETLTESRALLTSRFNAHLTFNVMNSIQGCLLEKAYDDAFELVTSYSRILRKMLINGKLESTLGEEMETIRDYLQIEKIRNDNQLDFTIDLDDLSPRLLLPKSLLVSFVENGVKHGIRTLNGEGWIRISGKTISDPVNNSSQTHISIRNLAPAKINGWAHEHQIVHGHELAYQLMELYNETTGHDITIEVVEHPVDEKRCEVEVTVVIQ
jgi:sensor histidine kinase YesM